MRGNRGQADDELSDWRSIPACAGEPTPYRHSPPPIGVYPRVCGGTGVDSDETPTNRGLSPRVRGNRLATMLKQTGNGSIPACAGEPRSRWARRSLSRVYPRVCGGTPCGLLFLRALPGLSPRVRGNQPRNPQILLEHRSIPACAGEPTGRRLNGHTPWVYPRVCGGTSARANTFRFERGLSPRVRGNLLAMGEPIDVLRSIPACAGEPTAPHAQNGKIEVYPRVCGGTSDRL